MSPKRILIFSLTYYPRFVGGAEVAIKEITDRMPENKYVFDMVTLRFDADLPRFERMGNVNVYRVGPGLSGVSTPGDLRWYKNFFKYLYLVIGFRKALVLHKNKKYDAIWSIMATYNSFSAVFFKMVHPKVPFIFTLQDGDPIEHIKKRALPLYPFFKKMFTKADRVQAISNHLASWAKNMGSTCPIEVIPNAVDYALFSKDVSKESIEEISKNLGMKEEDIFIITTSRLVRKNALNDLIDSLVYLPKNIKLLILGEGPLRESLKAQCFRLGLNYTDEPPINPHNRVHFMGQIGHADMPAYFALSKVFVRPSLSEGLGNSFLESMAAGVPVVATSVGGISDFVKDGETGLICEVKNPRSIAQKIEKYLKDQESYDYILRKGRLMVREKYDWMSISDKMRGLFDGVLN